MSIACCSSRPRHVHPSVNDLFAEPRHVGRVDERPHSLALPRRDVPPEAVHVAANVLGLVLERHEDAALAVLGDARGDGREAEGQVAHHEDARQQPGPVAGGDAADFDRCGVSWSRRFLGEPLL